MKRLYSKIVIIKKDERFGPKNEVFGIRTRDPKKPLNDVIRFNRLKILKKNLETLLVQNINQCLCLQKTI